MKLIEPYLIRLVSPATETKPETTVHAEVLGIRERYAFEILHFHEQDKTTCAICGKSGRMVWTDSTEQFERDSNRCGNIPVVEVHFDD